MPNFFRMPSPLIGAVMVNVVSATNTLIAAPAPGRNMPEVITLPSPATIKAPKSEFPLPSSDSDSASDSPTADINSVPPLATKVALPPPAAAPSPVLPVTRVPSVITVLPA
jgi:hypothetical protein